MNHSTKFERRCELSERSLNFTRRLKFAFLDCVLGVNIIASCPPGTKYLRCVHFDVVVYCNLPATSENPVCAQGLFKEALFTLNVLFILSQLANYYSFAV